MRKLLSILTIMLAVALSASGYARTVGNYNERNLTEDGGNPKKMPFSITRIEQQSGQLRLWIQAGNDGINNVANLVNNGKLDAQLSDGENGKTVSLSLRKAVTCKKTGTYQLEYSDASPKGCTVEKTEYYLNTPVTLVKNRDLAIGFDPDFLWLVEVR